MDIKLLYSFFLDSKGISIDSRFISEGEIFIAIKGEFFDGNTFVNEALQQGAMYAVVNDSKYKNEDDRIILIPSSNGIETLQKLATLHRSKMKSRILAVTGSNGKTTTKELLNALLSSTYKTLSTQGNLNNHIGVPLTLLRIKKDTEIAIIEMGANHLKEISFLCEIAKPNYAYITSFGKAHLDGFGSLEGVIQAKSELYNYVKTHKGLIFYNIDDSIQLEACKSYTHTFNFSTRLKPSNCMISLISDENFLTILYKDLIINTSFTGSYNLSNIGAAITVSQYFDIDNRLIKSILESYVPIKNRSQLLLLNKESEIIADSYNANPTSIKVALQSLLSRKGRHKLAILGDMFELGDYSINEHQSIVDLADKWHIPTLLFGDHFENTKCNFPKFKTYEGLKSYIKKQLPFEETTILVKGSRGMKLERIIDFISHEQAINNYNQSS